MHLLCLSTAHVTMRMFSKCLPQVVDKDLAILDLLFTFDVAIVMTAVATEPIPKACFLSIVVDQVSVWYVTVISHTIHAVRQQCLSYKDGDNLRLVFLSPTQHFINAQRCFDSTSTCSLTWYARALKKARPTHVH